MSNSNQESQSYSNEPAEDQLPAGMQVFNGGGNGITTNRASVLQFDLSKRSKISGIDNLIFRQSGGTKWGTGINQGLNLTFSFSSTTSTFLAGLSPGSKLNLTTQQMATARQAMQVYANISNLSFTEVTDTSSSAGDIRWGRSADTSDVKTAYARYPSNTGAGGDIWLGMRYDSDYQNATLGSYGYQTYLHELGHALGLMHPHEGSIAAAPGEDQLKYSIMSYRSYDGASLSFGYTNGYFPTSLMLNDIAAIQYLYGVNTSYQSGNNTYSWATNSAVFETIYDSGGIDTISASNQSQGVLINLNSGSWSQIGSSFWNGQAYVRDCLTIAYSSAIENATGSVYSDSLIGNSLANILDGGAGADTMTGGLGDDTYYIDNTNDKVIEYIGGGYDTIYSTSATTYMPDEVEVLRQTSNGSYMNGNNSDNLIYGNPSDNEIWGRQGDDNISAGDGNDKVYGNPGNDTLYGGRGNDILDGGLGNDILSDRDGNDTYQNFFRGFGLDKIFESEESTPNSFDTVIFQSANSAPIYHDQLWFSRKGNDLEISIIGQANDSTLTIDSWYADRSHQVELFKAADNNKSLSTSNVDKLVNAMAAFSPPAMGQYSLPSQYSQSLNSVIASCWT